MTATDGTTTAPADRLSAGRSLGLAVSASLAAGGALLVSFPPYGLWWAAPVGVALLALATHQRRARAGALLGFIAGFAFFAPLLAWTAIHPAVGTWPWLLLSALQAAFVALLGAAAAYTSGLAAKWPAVWPLLTATLWVAVEALRSRIPFGGFPWGRLAFSQGDAPTLQLAAIGGAPLVTFAVALAGGCLAAAVWHLPSRIFASAGNVATTAVGRSPAVRVTAGMAAAVLVTLSGLAVPVPASAGARGTPVAGRDVVVAIVQGNVPRLGLEFNAQERAVLDNHVNGTITLAREVTEKRRPQPDLVIWPENASDVDPLANEDARSRIDAAATAINAPILVGGLRRADNGTRNVGILWLPGTGPAATYQKRHPVPFAEYVPLRSFARMVTDKVDMAGNFIPGTDPGVMTANGITFGDVICFEVAYDSLVRDTVTGGGQLIVVQTNNATFNEAEAAQQMAMVQLRAVEHRRPALMASTVGISGFVTADGRVHDATTFNTAAVRVRTVQLNTDRTLATRLGVIPELVMAGLAVVAVAWVLVQRRTVRRRTVTATTMATPAPVSSNREGS